MRAGNPVRKRWQHPGQGDGGRGGGGSGRGAAGLHLECVLEMGSVCPVHELGMETEGSRGDA